MVEYCQLVTDYFGALGSRSAISLSSSSPEMDISNIFAASGVR